MIEKFTYKGLWFLPENPERQVTGILTFDPSEGADLELLGTLVDLKSSKEHHEPNFILGITTDNKAVTLYNSFEYNRSFLSGIDTCKYTTNFVIIGDHYTNEDEFVFDKIKGRFKNLDEWISEFGFKDFEPDFKNHKITVDYELPKPIEFKISDELKGKFNFTFSSPLTRHTHKFIVEQKTEIIFETEMQKPFFETLDNLMLFQNFLTLGTFEPAYPISIWLSNKTRKDRDDEKSRVIQVQLIYKPGFSYTEGRKKILWEFLLNYRDIAQNFETIIQKWFTQKDKIDPVTNLLFDSFYQRKRFNENSFLNIVQALETFHRRFRKNEIMPKTEHKNMISEIIKSVKEDYKKWLQDRLNFSNEPTLHHRLEKLIEELSLKTVSKIIKDKELFIKDTKNSRNYYTHYDLSMEKKALKRKDLYMLTEKLRVLLIAIVLLETGLTKEQVDILFERNEFKFFNHIIGD
jgi:hypothetical protein